MNHKGHKPYKQRTDKGMVRGRVPNEERFWAKVSPVNENGCRLWLGAKSRSTGGYYGSFSQSFEGTTRRSQRKAHVYAWELAHGPVPDGLELDHLCRVRMCVEETHLEPVTSQVNSLRGNGISSVNASKVFCNNGHPLFGDNIRMEGKSRRCIACAKESMARFIEKNPLYDKLRDRKAEAEAEAERRTQWLTTKST